MTTDVGDLIPDPTSGSGTAATVAEQFGRRWISIDTSRVALSIARERLLSSVYAFYALSDDERGVDGGFKYEPLQRVTLRSIARDTGPEEVTRFDKPLVELSKVRVAGPFTVEALSRYAVNPNDESVRGSRMIRRRPKRKIMSVRSSTPSRSRAFRAVTGCRRRWFASSR